jgi:outer membrane immunogenic protein
MKILTLSAVSIAMLTGTAFAADLPSRKEPVASPPAPPMWTGFHVGVNAGGIWNNNNSISVSTWPINSGVVGEPILWAPLNGTLSSGSNGGFIGGGQIGYDWQVPFNGMGFVTGVEADIQGIASNNGSQARNSLYSIPDAPNATVWNNVNGSANLQYLGTFRGRFGYLVSPALLVYATGGLAYGGVSAHINQTQFTNYPTGVNGPGGDATFGNANYSNTQVGYTAGGGVEWMFLPNWSAKAEYLYYNLGNVSMTSLATGVPTGSFVTTGTTSIDFSSTARTTVSGNIVRAGVNYHFNFGAAPVVAKF